VKRFAAAMLDAAKRTAGKSGMIGKAANWCLNTQYRVYWRYYRPIVKKRMDYRGCQILTPAKGNDAIARLLESGEPAAIGKLGNVEARALASFISCQGRPVTWDADVKLELYRNAGVFPANDEVMSKWCVQFIDSLKSLDLVGLWFHRYESQLVKRFAVEATLAVDTSLEPYYHKNPWSRCLKNKRVLVISPFADSIRRQYQYRDKIWQDDRCLPDFRLDAIRAPLSDALVKSPFKDWFEALQHMTMEISRREFDAAIVGAGAYSIPLIAHIKQRGKFAIHLGGATQILFGIKGDRWDNMPRVSRFYNKYWTRPSKDETPSNASIVEGACYW
jgi:hypothetical protein